jgi:hypothetical protein
MGNSETTAGFIGILAIVGRIISVVYSGIWAFDWVEPKSFFSFIGFLIVWGILGKILDFILVLVIGGVIHFFEGR